VNYTQTRMRPNLYLRQFFVSSFDGHERSFIFRRGRIAGFQCTELRTIGSNPISLHGVNVQWNSVILVIVSERCRVTGISI